MKHLSVTIKPASSLCNLRCKYCFYGDIAELRQVRSFGVMRPEVTEGMLEKLRASLEPGDAITIAFQGGEPTLAGLDYFQNFTDTVDGWGEDFRVFYTLQTNATLLDEQWCRFLAQRRFLVGVSLDLLPDCHDSCRVDAMGAGTYRQVIKAIGLLERYGVEYNVLCTLSNQVARHPRQVWKKIQRLDLGYVQFTPCLDGLDAAKHNGYALTPKRFAFFYTQLFSLWLQDFRSGKYRSIKLFDDLVNLLAFGRPTACGILGSCQPQTVIEADGSVYPCDFYCLDAYRLGSILENTVEQLCETPAASAFLRREHRRPELCGTCPFEPMCHGGCKRMWREVYCGTGDSDCGYQAFLRFAIDDLREIAMEQRTLRRRE